VELHHDLQVSGRTSTETCARKPSLMTGETQKPNGSDDAAAAASATSSGSKDQITDVDRTIPSKSNFPPKDKGTSASGSDELTKSPPKKRRKVNHGKEIMLCFFNSVDSPC
jgi:hypothetical protein